MKRMKKYISALLVIILAVACSKEKSFIQLESGLAYRKIEDKKGKKPEEGQAMGLELVSVYKDSVIAKPNQPGGFFLNPRVGTPPMLTDVLVQCGEGDSIEIKFSLDQYAQLTGMPTMGMDTTESIYMRLRVTEVDDQKVFMDRIQAEMARQQAEAAAKYDEQLETDKGIIKSYLAENNLEAEETEDGIFIVRKKKGNGPKAEAGQRATVDYVVRLLDGTYIDTSHKKIAEESGIYNARREPYKPYSFTVGRREVVQGWDLGVPKVAKGGSATLFVPSGLAYGPNPRPGSPIPANAILMFDIEVVDVK